MYLLILLSVRYIFVFMCFIVCFWRNLLLFGDAIHAIAIFQCMSLEKTKLSEVAMKRKEIILRFDR